MMQEYISENVQKLAHGYQTVIDGKVKILLDLSREELILELIDSIDKFEYIDEKAEELSQIVAGWREGRRTK